MERRVFSPGETAYDHVDGEVVRVEVLEHEFVKNTECGKVRVESVLREGEAPASKPGDVYGFEVPNDPGAEPYVQRLSPNPFDTPAGGKRGRYSHLRR